MMACLPRFESLVLGLVLAWQSFFLLLCRFVFFQRWDLSLLGWGDTSIVGLKMTIQQTLIFCLTIKVYFSHD